MDDKEGESKREVSHPYLRQTLEVFFVVMESLGMDSSIERIPRYR